MMLFKIDNPIETELFKIFHEKYGVMNKCDGVEMNMKYIEIV